MFGRALTSVAWGVVADRYDRKPVIIMGTFILIKKNYGHYHSVSTQISLCIPA